MLFWIAPSIRYCLLFPFPPTFALPWCGGANRFRDIYDTLLAYERADWPAVAGAAARLAQIENAIPDCYQVAATCAAALPF